MIRNLLAALIAVGTTASVQASFTLTGNPVADPGWTFHGHSLQQGGYVRGTANFSYNIYTTEFNLPSGANPLTNMANPWNPGDRVIGMGGVFTTPMSPTALGWPTGTTFTGPSQNALIAANTRVTAKFGVPNPTNAYTASTTPPTTSDGLGSHSGGNGGLGSVQVSIFSNRFVPANAGMLQVPTTITGGGVTGPDNVAQWAGTIGSNGLDLFDAGTNTFPSARYIFTTDPNTGFLTAWEVLLNTTMVQQYPGANPIVPIGGGNWIMSIQAGSGAAAFTDGLIKSDTYYPAPAPPAIALAFVGAFGLAGLKRFRKS